MIQTYTTRLVHKEELAPSIYRFRFRVENGEQVVFAAGQYMILMVPQPNGQMARRLYSILTPPTEREYFDIVVEIFETGLASQYLMRMHEDDEVVFQGPAGVFILKESNRPKIFLATGTGIVPMMSILQNKCQTDESCNMMLFWGLQKKQDLYLFKELKQLAQLNPNFQLNICLSRDSSLDIIPEEDRKYFMKGRVTVGFDELAKTHDLLLSDYYVCGGREVVESLRQYLYVKGIPKELVHFEKF